MTTTNTLAVWSGREKAGLLARERRQEYVFAYSADAAKGAQVSLTMPVRLESWLSRELHPVFQMNLPEGALLEVVRRAIAKVEGDDDLSILKVTGGNQIGRNRFTLPDSETPNPEETPESLDELLTFPDTRELFLELVARYSLRSGISGVQPKVLLEATERGTIAASGYIVKSWGDDYPHLAANEFFCMTAAKRAGLAVPEFHLSDNGGLFVMKRFDVAPDGEAIGFEDLCSLQALGTAQKYSSSYERVARTLKSFISPEHLIAAREQFFATLVLSIMLRNGDAHLKNFGVLHQSPAAHISLAPVYDLVTTTAYISKDVPALTLDGRKIWWPRRMLERFAVAHLSLSMGTVAGIIERMANAVMETKGMIPGYIREHPEFKEIGERIMLVWEEGVSGTEK
ncbi:MAG TPA: type II toxin-antitoxin system HipA family toxin [Desulfuromonadales bacterium]|nr:type II toxin-antitoxin system HipA family toxin [Desulfuromonadales bacterium]